MRKSLIAFLSGAILFVLCLTVSNGSYGITESDTPCVENPVFIDVDLTCEVNDCQIATLEGISTSETLLLDKQIDPDTQGTLNRQEIIHMSFVSVVRLAFYRQDYKSIYTQKSSYG